MVSASGHVLAQVPIFSFHPDVSKARSKFRFGSIQSKSSFALPLHPARQIAAIGFDDADASPVSEPEGDGLSAFASFTSPACLGDFSAEQSACSSAVGSGVKTPNAHFGSNAVAHSHFESDDISKSAVCDTVPVAATPTGCAFLPGHAVASPRPRIDGKS